MGKCDRITVEPGKLGGKPCIRGMRISVAHVLRLVSAYPCFADIIAEFPELEEEDIRQALRYAADGLDGISNTDGQDGQDGQDQGGWDIIRRPGRMEFTARDSTKSACADSEHDSCGDWMSDQRAGAKRTFRSSTV